MTARLLLGLAAMTVAASLGCGSSAVSPASRVADQPSAPGPSVVTGSSPAPTAVIATVSQKPTAPSPIGSEVLASSKPVAIGERAAVPLEVPPPFRTGKLAEPRMLTLPAGFKANVFAAGLTSPRFMAMGPGNTIFATGIGGGLVYALHDRDADGVSDETNLWADGLSQPHGLAFHQGYLYVGETNRVVRYRVGQDGTRQSGPEIVIPGLPSGGGHRTRTVGFGPDGRLFVSIGSSCNVCVENDERRAAIVVYNPDGSDGRVFMRGLRNAVGFVWRPDTDELWATNNGRDQLGDDLPMETVYRVRDGGNAGWPSCYPAPDGLRPDPQFGGAGACDNVDAPVAAFQAHSAPLGLRFYDGTSFPEATRGDLFVALHGSWNRSTPVGYKVIRIPLEGDTIGPAEDFATGWMADEGNRGSVWGRPVDLLVASDGALLISDDDGGAIYRIAYQGS